jgi:hypothetical protein
VLARLALVSCFSAQRRNLSCHNAFSELFPSATCVAVSIVLSVSRAGP